MKWQLEAMYDYAKNKTLKVNASDQDVSLSSTVDHVFIGECTANSKRSNSQKTQAGNSDASG